jgi:hypothetical protein
VIEFCSLSTKQNKPTTKQNQTMPIMPTAQSSNRGGWPLIDWLAMAGRWCLVDGWQGRSGDLGGWQGEYGKKTFALFCSW